MAVAPSHVARRLRRSVGLPEREGLLVRGVEDGSLAAKAGIQEGDLIVEAAGRPVTDADALFEALAAASVPFEVKVVRGTEERTVSRRRHRGHRRGLIEMAIAERHTCTWDPVPDEPDEDDSAVLDAYSTAVSAVAETLIPSVASLRVDAPGGRLVGRRSRLGRWPSRRTDTSSRRPTSWPARIAEQPRSSTARSASSGSSAAIR